MDLAIIPECYVDTNLVETLVPPEGKGYNHQHGCGTVTKVMQGKFTDRFALGIIDKDKKELDYLSEFIEVIDLGSLILHKHKVKHHYIIQIYPAIERFFVDNATAAGISLENYDLPNDFDSLKKLSKQEQSKKDLRFKSLFKAIKAAGADDFIKLAKWVAYLRDNNYKAKIEDLE